MNYRVVTDKVTESFKTVTVGVAEPQQMATYYADRPSDRDQTVEGMAISHATKTMHTLERAKEKLAKPQKAIQSLLMGRSTVASRQSASRTSNTAAESAAIARFDTDTDMDLPQTGWLMFTTPEVNKY